MDKITDIEQKFKVDPEDCILKHYRKENIRRQFFKSHFLLKDGFKLQIKEYIN